MKNVLEEANEITSGARRKSYGHPRENFDYTAKLWSAYLGFELAGEDVGMLMILLKIAREAHNKKRDNLVDICGYARTLELYEEADGK